MIHQIFHHSKVAEQQPWLAQHPSLAILLVCSMLGAGFAAWLSDFWLIFWLILLPWRAVKWALGRRSG